MASAAQPHSRPDDDRHGGLISRVGWLAFTMLIGLIVSLLAGWAQEMRSVDRRNEQDIRALESRLGKLEAGTERIEAKVDLLLERGVARRK